MLDLVESWIDQTNHSYRKERRSCSIFEQVFKGFYSPIFLSSSYFVIVDSLPTPDFQQLRDAGLGDFLDGDFDGITYKDTYYLLPHAASRINIHFHELVHVIQWRALTATGFVQRYISEMQAYGYGRQAPLEAMAYGLEDSFEDGRPPLDIERHVLNNL
ncbi:MAG: hypothetical protein MI744_18240 [Pseudomonadales bacterium]|nr:hypothetical protein [Pseudomonadales bacterium]